MTRYTEFESPLGPMLAAADDGGLLGLWFHDQRYQPETQGWIPGPLDDIRRQVDEYFAGQRQDFDLPLNPRGTDFQREVWTSLQGIPFGQTSTYGRLAHQLGRPTGSRAVGAAVGRNPLSLIVPCHRVVGADGSLTGYAGGLERKAWLLKLEGAICAEEVAA